MPLQNGTSHQQDIEQESRMAYGTADEALLTVLAVFKKMSYF